LLSLVCWHCRRSKRKSRRACTSVYDETGSSWSSSLSGGHSWMSRRWNSRAHDYLVPGN